MHLSSHKTSRIGRHWMSFWWVGRDDPSAVFVSYCRLLFLAFEVSFFALAGQPEDRNRANEDGALR